MNAAAVAVLDRHPRPCIHCSRMVDPDPDGRLRDREGCGWCPNRLLAHAVTTTAPAPRDGRS